MNYKLAKELKDAGFPQEKGRGELQAYDKSGVEVDFAMVAHDEVLYIPCLSELIEACLKIKEAIQLNIDKDGCGAWIGSGQRRETFQQGKTPEEAVSRLWLKLNKK